MATCQELIEKLANLFNASPSVIVDVHLLGVNKIHILVTDEVVANMVENSQYTVEVLKSESYRYPRRINDFDWMVKNLGYTSGAVYHLTIHG